MSIKIVVIADLHFSENKNHAAPSRRGEFADIFLLRAVHRLNRFIKPDIVLFMGDMINEPDKPNSLGLLKELKSICDKLETPYIVIPGNHDPEPGEFYSVFEKATDFIDVKGVRFIPFIDNEEPGYNASRSKKNMQILRKAGNSFDGQIVCLQHVPLFPPEMSDCPHHYINAEKIIGSMKKYGANLAISGHYHKGMELLESDGISYLTAPAFCETPFKFIELDLTKDGAIQTKYHVLKNPEENNLIDYHVHTSMAYCNENMDMLKSVELGKAFGLSKIGFGEHSGHLYFDSQTYCAGKYLLKGINFKPISNRTNKYFKCYRKIASDYTILGMEVDCDFSGKPVIKPAHWKKMQVLIGAVHYLPEFKNHNPDTSKAIDEFLFLNERFLKTGIKILAHPFRVFRRGGVETPKNLFKPLIRLLKENDVAAEINYHTNEPSVEFFSMCINEGIKLSFGSDSHNLYEIGEFYPHIQFIKKCGYNGDLKDILVSQEDVMNQDFEG